MSPTLLPRAVAVLLLTTIAAAALDPDELLADPALEMRARAISGELRCLVCQNQSIDDSDAPLARDLRLLVRDRLKAGDSDGQIRDFVVRRYGEFVLLRPVWGWHTALLWIGPLVLVVGAAAALVLTRRRVGSTAEVPLTPEEEARIDALAGSPSVAAVTPPMAAREG